MYIRSLWQKDRRLIVRMLANELDLGKSQVWQIITQDLNTGKVGAKTVPRLLKDDQKDRRLQVRQDILGRLETDPDFLRRVITGDERLQ